MEKVRYIAALQAGGDALLDAARLGLERPVPAYPGWMVAYVVWHTAGGFQHKVPFLAPRLQEPPPRPAPAPADADPFEWFITARAALVDALRGIDPSEPVWTWPAGSGRAGFWFRRTALERAVHRVDAQSAHAVLDPVAVELAVEGTEEILNVIVAPRALDVPASDLLGAIHLRCSDADATWGVRLTTAGVVVTRDPDAAGHWDAVAGGTASAILLFLLGRQPVTVMSTHDPDALLPRIRALAADATG